MTRREVQYRLGPCNSYYGLGLGAGLAEDGT